VELTLDEVHEHVVALPLTRSLVEATPHREVAASPGSSLWGSLMIRYGRLLRGVLHEVVAVPIPAVAEGAGP
jgi:hypothetical protein